VGERKRERGRGREKEVKTETEREREREKKKEILRAVHVDCAGLTNRKIALGMPWRALRTSEMLTLVETPT